MATHKTRHDYEVAIKVLKKEKLYSNQDCIRKEIDKLCELHHPNISKYIEQYETDTHMYIVMEFVTGITI